MPKLTIMPQPDEGRLSRPFPRVIPRPTSQMRVNGKIRAREVRVIGPDGKQLGVFHVERRAGHRAPARRGPCRNLPQRRAARLPSRRNWKVPLRKGQEGEGFQKHQHASTVKEVQLSPRIDPHDLGIKVQHAIDFLCEDMKVKVALKFRGREMAHQESVLRSSRNSSQRSRRSAIPIFSPSSSAAPST